MKKVIALVDCNNFFVACERLYKPELINKPVCVLSNNDGCVVSRSNEAKRLGVPMGIPYFIAKNQFKNVIFLSGNLPFYCEISQRIMTKLKDFTPDIEIYSIDEAFLDLTGLNKTFNLSFQELVKKISKDIKEEIGIDVSVGLSYSKVLAKLASEKAKEIQKQKRKETLEEKTYVIGYREIENELKNTPISNIWGIGKNINHLLKKYYIKSAYDFTIQEDVWIKRTLGKIGLDLKKELRGESINPVNNKENLPKSISRSESFKEFQTDKNYIQKELNSHIHKVCKKLRELNLKATCIEIFLRTKDFQILNLKLNLITPSNSELELTKYSKELLSKLYNKYTIYRSVGFCVMKLVQNNTEQISLFDCQIKEKQNNLSSSWDKLEEKFGKGIINLGQV